jgi:hypothetical protein
MLTKEMYGSSWVIVSTTPMPILLPESARSIAVLLLLVVLLLGTLLLLTILPQCLDDFMVLLFLEFVPLDIVLICDRLDLLSQSIAVLDQDLPLAQVEVVLLVELLLATRDCEIHSAAVTDLAIVVQEPDITSDQGGETDEVL